MKEIKTFSNEDRYAIGNRIADLRETKGYKSMEIAQFMDIDRSTYSNIECGKTKLSTENLYKLCQIFDVSADYILFGETEDSYMEEIKTILNGQKLEEIRKIVRGLRAMLSSGRL